MPPAILCADPRDAVALKTIEAELGVQGIPFQTLPWHGRETDIPRQSHDALSGCAAFVPIVSRRSVGTRWLDSLVRQAYMLNRLIFPLKLGTCRFRGELEFFQYEWFNQRPSDHWFERLRAVCAADAVRPEVVLRGHEQGIWGLSYEHKFSASGSWDRTVRIWTNNPLADAQRDGRRVVIPLEHRVLALAYAPNGRELAIGCEDGSIHIWSPHQSRITEVLTGHLDAVRSLAYTSDSDLLFSASADSTARLWPRSADWHGRELRPVAHSKNVLGVACDPHDNTFATVSEDTMVKVWNIPPTNHAHRSYAGHTATVWGVAYSPTDRELASVSRDKTVRIWDLDTEEQVACLEGHQGSVICVAYSPNGRYLATGSADETARVWERRTGQLISVLTGHSDAIRAIAFAPGLDRLTTAGADGTIMHWPLPPGVSAGGHSAAATTSRP